MTGEQALARHFSAGAGNLVQVVGNADVSPELRSAVAATPGVSAVTPPGSRMAWSTSRGR